MRSRLGRLFGVLRASYWFVPTLMTFGSALLALFMIRVDENLDLETFRQLGFVYYNEPDGARALVSTVAGSMITVAGTTFSITLAVLSLTSGQFGPRLLNNFMRDTGNQIVLGTFVSTYVYCLLVLRTIHGDGTFTGEAFVPHLSVILAIVFALSSLGVFIYFIHHTASSIQASNITDRITADLERMIRKLYADPDDAPDPTTPRPQALDPQKLDPQAARAVSLKGQRSAYLQTVDEDGLRRFAEAHSVTLKSLYLPGTFVLEAQPVALVWPDDTLDQDERGELSAYFTLGSNRTPAHDLDFLFDQLSEMALRALSPGVNDPVTAMRCADRIVQGLYLMVTRRPPPSYHYDDEGRLRLIVPQIGLENLVADTLGELRRFSADNMLVSLHLLDLIGTLLVGTDHSELRRALLNEATLIREGSKKVLLDADFARLESRYREVINASGPAFVRPAR